MNEAFGRVRTGIAVLAAGVLLAGAAACGAGGTASPDASASPVVSATPAGPAPLTILVSNDDGVGAPGIDALVNGLRTLPEVTVEVVAPIADQSGTGGRTSPSTPAHQDAQTASGVPATAVDGYPADSVSVALDVLGLKPDLVISGINKGQNLGPFIDLSGTVGAARAAAARGIPAIAASFGFGTTYDYSQAVAVVVAWVSAHRAEFTEMGAEPLDTLANLNIPNCGGAEIRGVKELPSEPTVADAGTALTTGQNCSSTDTPSDEVGAFNNGFATLTTIPGRPAA